MDQAENITFFMRFTTIVGNTSVESDPYDVTGYKSIDVEAFLQSLTGTAAAMTATLETSSDMVVWTPVDGPDPMTAGQVTPLTKTSPSR
jgi:hypothetical protein